MILLLILFVCANALDNRVVRRIEQCVHSHAYVPDVDAMCHVVLERMKFKGIFLASPSLCTNASIVSDYGATLSELYGMYDKIDSKHLKTHMAELNIQTIECRKTCQFTLLFGNSIERWVDKHAPIPVPAKCYPYPGSLKGTQCIPFVNVTLGNFELTRDAWSVCVDCLEQYDERVRVYNNFRLEYLRFPAILTREIALVWRRQMPTALAAAANSAIIKY